MLLMTGNGSGGSREAVRTTYDDPDDDGYKAHEIAEMGKQVDAIPIGREALRGEVNIPSVDWLGKNALRPSLGLTPPSEFADLHTPLPEMVEGGSRFN